MENLSRYAGFSLWLDPNTFRLTGRGKWSRKKPDVRTLDAMRAVLRDPDVEGPRELYWMYRDVGPVLPVRGARRMGLRFDLTVLRPGTLSGEFIKTFGHDHPASPDGLSYPELYQVVAGKALFLLQSRNELWLIPAGAGERVWIPPGFGHVTVNVGDRPLVLANWVAADFSSDYGAFRERHGAAVYVMAAAGEQAFDIVENPRVKPAPVIRWGTPDHHRLPGEKEAGEPIFLPVARDPQSYRFLLRPSERLDFWRRLEKEMPTENGRNEEKPLRREQGCGS